MDALFPALQWFQENMLFLGTVLFLLFKGKYVYNHYVHTPLAGGNGKIQMDELVKGVIVAVFIWSINREGHRTHEWTYFSDAYYAALLAALFAIAAIKPVVGIWKSTKEEKHDNEEPSNS